MSRLLKYATCGNKQIPIYVASEVRDAGYRRLVDIIDPKVLNDTVDKVKAAAESNRLLSATQASSTSSIVITYVSVWLLLRDHSLIKVVRCPTQVRKTPMNIAPLLHKITRERRLRLDMSLPNRASNR